MDVSIAIEAFRRMRIYASLACNLQIQLNRDEADNTTDKPIQADLEDHQKSDFTSSLAN